MTRPIKASELEQIMAEALAELMHQAQRAQGVRNAEHTRRKAEEWRSGPRSQLGGHERRGSGTTDPTGSARPDKGDEIANEYAEAWRQILKDMRRLRKAVGNVNSQASAITRQTNSQVRLCAVPWCRDDIISPLGEVPDRGRCEPCANYYRRHGEDPGPTTIEARRRKRAERERV